MSWRPLRGCPDSFSLPTCHAALVRAASAPRSAGSVAQASSLRAGIPTIAGRCWPWPLVRRHEPIATTRLRAGIACKPDRLDDRHEHVQHSRDHDGERYTTRRIVSVAGAAAMLLHSKPRDTRITSGYSNPSSTRRHGWSGALPPGQSLKPAPLAIIPADTHVVDTSCG